MVALSLEAGSVMVRLEESSPAESRVHDEKITSTKSAKSAMFIIFFILAILPHKNRCKQENFLKFSEFFPTKGGSLPYNKML